ncbi:hypothetical protein [Desulfopila aestuarii]|uniref:Uncharacterized protein n=1 Tax=Desulfopila aestuarii DSM 18488 TaxID=1121416 RepID=A0A1M7YJT6_9BACT|nr:hypothetical protein [Desulfopila aestuarii]SHO52883.1 hypothetical protein SAMN02745220_04818 [Desulfopila aestuarii DSM 18488]
MVMGVSVEIILDGKQYTTGIKPDITAGEMEQTIHDAALAGKFLSLGMGENSLLLLSPSAIQRAAFFIEEWA